MLKINKRYNTLISFVLTLLLGCTFINPSGSEMLMAEEQQNITGLAPAAPSIDPPGGSYSEVQDIIIGNIDDGTIAYYTTDGSDPRSGGTAAIYTGSFLLNESATVEAAVYEHCSGLWSEITSAEFIIADEEDISKDAGPLAAEAFMAADIIKVAGSAADSSATMAAGNTNLASSDNSWEIDVASGTLNGLEGDDLTDDVTLSGFPEGLYYAAENGGDNNIIITIAGTAGSAVSTQTEVSLTILGSAVSEVGAGDSDSIALYLHPAGHYPIALAVNESTNMIYVANKGSKDVTVMSGISDAVLATIGAGTYPRAIAVNPDTNKIYVTNQQDQTVMVIDGDNNEVVTTLASGTYPVDLAINRTTNKIYAANNSSQNVTVIDGDSDSVDCTISAGNSPYDLAINENTNMIYSANYYDQSISVIDGDSNTVTSTVTSDKGPYAAAVNPITNKIYVTNLKNLSDAGSVTVLDGAANTASSITVGVKPRAIAVNPVTNMIYVANLDNDNVMVIDGSTDTVTATVSTGDGPLALGINQSTNVIYVANCGDNTVTIIDGATNNTTSVAAGDYPCAIAVNESSNKAYVANQYSDNITVIDYVPASPPAAPTIDPDGGTYTAAQSVSIENIADGTTAYYTIDGSDPSNSGTAIVYGESFLLGESATVKAAVYDDDHDLWSSVTSADFIITIPADPDISSDFTDPNFKQAIWEWLGHAVDSTPGSFTKQDLVDRVPAQNYILNVDRSYYSDSQKICSLAGLEHFEGTGLKTLDCWANKLTSLPTLPSSLEELRCGLNQLTSLPNLPDGLGALWCGGNLLISLPDLPASLTQTLSCENNYLKVFSDPLISRISSCPAEEKITTPQYRYTYPGATIQLTGSGTYQVIVSNLQMQSSSNGSDWVNDTTASVSMSDFAFSTSDAGVATVSAGGLITAQGAGSCNIYADFLGINAEYTRVIIPVQVGPVPELPLAPVISPDGGRFTSSQTITITGSGGDIFYTLDGSNPISSSTSTEYTRVFILSKSAVVKAAVHGETGWSEVASASFKISSGSGGGGGSSYEPSPISYQEGEVFGPESSSIVLRFTIGSTAYYVNDNPQTMDIAPMIQEDRTLLPVRYVAEPLGAAVNWDQDEQKVNIALNDKTIELWIGENTALINGVRFPIDPNNPEVNPILLPPGRSMLPIRFIAESLGCQVDWNPDTKEVKVSYPK